MSSARPARLKDIAQGLGLSVMAVSKALRGHADIAPATRERVLRKARELNYRPNVLPRQMLSGRTMTVGIVVPTLGLSYFAELVHGATARLRREGYQVLLADSEHDLEQEREHVNTLLAHRADGIVLASVAPMGKAGELRYLFEAGTPFVLAGRGIPGYEADFVGSDGVRIGELATGCLIDGGCRRLAHVQGPPVAGAFQRREGFERTVKRRRLELDPKRIAGDSDGVEAGYRAMRTLLSRKPDAVFCYTDLTAVGAMRAILEAGLRIPEDIALAGVGNLQFTDMLQVPLTTVEQYPFRIGGEAAAALVTKLRGAEADPPRRVIVPCRLIERASTRRIRGKRRVN